MADLKCNTRRCSRPIMLTCISTLAGVLAPLFFVAAMLVVQSHQPGYSAIHDTISTLALGHFGWLQNLAFFAFGFMLAIFAWRLYITTNRSLVSKAGALAFFLSSLGFFPLGVFPPITDELGSIGRGMFHGAAAGGVGTFYILGTVAYTLHFRMDRQWEKFWRFTAITAVVSLAAFLLWITAPAEWQLKGLGERLLLFSGFVWLEIISFRLLRACHKTKCGFNFPFDVRARGGPIPTADHVDVT